VNEERVAKIETLLTESLRPSELLVKDQSHLHEGHAGAREGKGHFAVLIVADAFAGQSRLGRHRVVFDALGDMMETDIHALSIEAHAPGER